MLMTDLVGSTAMADRLGPSAAEDLRREHFALLRGALERTGGLEVKNLGDGLMMVFANATGALRCAVEIQQVIEARNRRSPEQLDVRIGISFGETTVDDGDYFGTPVVEAARLCAHARGGEIVVNAMVRLVAGAHAAHTFTSLGEIRLKGIAAPVEAFSLRWEPILAAGIALPERLRELPPTAFVGRVGERGRLSELWRESREGSLRFALIGGEAGVGKTRLATDFAVGAHADGATVLYGRCDEDLGVPYQPWTQALGHLVREAPSLILERYVECHGGDLARLLPALAERVPTLAAPRASDPETERYLLYAAAVGLLAVAGEQAPVLLILDDLHWADAPTLSLLRHMVAAGPAAPVMLVATYRDSDISREHPLTALLADLHREQSPAGRLRLSGLQAQDVLALMEAAAGHELDEDGRALARQITRETDGNPFFAGELLRHLSESGAIVQEQEGRWRVVGEISELGLPESVREVIGRRVERLGSDARTVLSAAAVIGRTFEIDLLLEVLELTEPRLLDLLDGAVEASLLKEHQERAGRFAFTHALVEYTLYEDLGATRRARLHRHVAEALEVKCGEEPGERLGELASHWAAAVMGTDTAKPVEYARRAAERALQQLAPDEALRWYRKALELQARTAHGDPSARCELLIGLGEAQRQVGSPEFRQTLLEAAALARELDDIDRLSRAVLANTRGWASNYGDVDLERVQSLEAADGALPDGDSRRALVLALLACELQFAGEPQRSRRVAAQAIEIARLAGDPACLAHTIANAGWPIVLPDTLPERARITSELTELALQLDDPRLSTRAATWGTMVCLEAGDRPQAERSLATIRALAANVPEPFIGYLRLLLEFGWALLQGELEAAEQWASQAYEAGAHAGQPDAELFFGAHLFHVRYFQGRAGELVDRVTLLGTDQETLSGWRAGAAALALIQDGREDEARELALTEDFGAIPKNEAWAIVMLLWADACSTLGCAEQANDLFELLAPFSGQVAVSGAHVYGTIDWALGVLAATVPGLQAEGPGHFAAAAELDRRLGAPLLLARTHASWARSLIARGDPGDLEAAQGMLEQAETDAGRLGAAGIVRDLAESRATLAVLGR